MENSNEYEVENKASVDLVEATPRQQFLGITPDRATDALLKIQNVSEILDKAVRIALRRTRPQDWVKMGDKFYLEASGVEKIRGVFGLYFRDRVVVREDMPDGTYAYICSGIAGCKLLDGLFGESITVDIEGARSSGDAFFAKQDREPDPMDIRKSAYANFIVRASKTLLGLGNYTEADLQEMGVSISKVTRVEYKKGAEGGGDKTFISEAQRKRLFAIAKKNGVTETQIKTHLKLFYKVESTEKIKRGDMYNNIVAWAESGGKQVEPEGTGYDENS